ncbi:anthranilate synthase alpha subunit 2, chloroplastic-like isoform X1 [Papaver somniferum]|uniref:anthranilate synthase alpha subunit 2, chloroplastic-like isoform X1 n=1 Tax=Papaver somniferum TaxID=3469 RepID=UPI000E6FD26D|nr:anthranilate synthase alpha subunit 2, chloroplastic-like isoform X1 [Papaver somniferum]
MKSLIISTTLSAHPSSLHSHCHRLSPVSFPVTNSVPIVTGFSTSHNQPSLFRHYQRSSTVLKCRVSTIVSPPAIDDDDKFKFMEAAKKGNLIPLHRCIFSDQLTPVQAYRCLVKEEDDRDAPSFIMESVEQGYENTQVGRYSYVGAQPTMEIVAKETSVTIMNHIKGIKTEKIVENPMEIPKTLMEEWSPQLLDELPRAFCGTRRCRRSRWYLPFRSNINCSGGGWCSCLTLFLGTSCRRRWCSSSFLTL